MLSTFVWLALAVAGLAYEFYALKDSDDLHQPLTFHLRRLVRRPWFAVLFVGFLIWLPLHVWEVVP